MAERAVNQFNELTNTLCVSAAIQEAYKLKQKGVQIITVGIGNDVSVDELEAVANIPKNVFRALNYDLLNYVEQSVATRTCQGESIREHRVLDSGDVWHLLNAMSEISFLLY